MSFSVHVLAFETTLPLPVRGDASGPPFAVLGREMEQAIERCRELATAQYGVISRKQVLWLGLSKRAIDSRLLNREWIRIFPAVYRVSGTSPSWLQMLKAATLWAGEGAAASHRAAAALWELDGFPEECIEISVPHSSSSTTDGAIVHCPSQLMRSEIVIRAGIPVTRVARTILDLGAVETPLKVEVALESALHQKRVTVDQLNECLAASGKRGRRGARTLRSILLNRARDASPTESVLETHLLALFRREGIPQPERQVEVIWGNGLIARLDFAYRSRRLAIEADGAEFHLRRLRWEGDQVRRNALVARGWCFLVVTWSRLQRDPRGVAAEVRRALEITSFRK